MTYREDPLLKLMDEHITRKKIIDPELRRVGWLEKYTKEEVNSLKSDFKKKDFILFRDGHESGDRFIDYVLLDENNSVLTIIESKKFSKDEEKGRIQARTYAKDIEKQLNQKVPIFLTNGHVWKFIDEDGIERKVSGPFNQEDLKRRSEIYKKKRNPRDVKVDTKIVDRPKSVQVVRSLSEYFSEGHRSALLVMATGTGKTRVAMAIIKLLIDANYVRNVLFIADRIPLVNQAKSNGFKQFFKEPVADLRKEGFSTNARLYVSTIQSLMNGKPRKLFERFSPGFFDLIVFDEAHRSYYDRNNLIHKYFDAIKIGLTATPREHESKNTYDLFGCDNGNPTAIYSYDEAVLDKVLVPYRAHIFETKVLSLGIKGKELTKDLKDQLIKQEQNPDYAEFSGSQFDRVFMDEKTNELIIREFMNYCYKSDEGKPCKSIFFCASQRHAKEMKRIFGKLFPKLSSDVQVITSEMARSEDEVVRFQLQSEPRIALSVGMLDTGVDIPEVCNLVFVKPVFSPIRFWQMIGRGTRSLSACKHPEWLPNKEKKDFLILDFKIGNHSNVKYHEFEVSKERLPSKGTLSMIFQNRVTLLKKEMDNVQRKIITQKIIDTLDSLDKNSFIIREKLRLINNIKEKQDEMYKHTKEIMDELYPLVVFTQSSNPNVSSFILQVEKLFSCILEENEEKKGKIQDYVYEMIENVLQKDAITEIRDNRDKLKRALQEEFWDDLTFEDVEFIITHIAPLMKYYEPNPRKLIQIDAPDLILSSEKFEKEIKEDKKLKELLERSTVIRKIKHGEGITSYELLELEKQLSSIRPELTIENIQKYQKKDFLIFLREIISLTYEYDPKELIEMEFDRFILKNSHYNPKQLEFLQLLKKIFAERKRIEISDLAEFPFDETSPLDYFTIDQLKIIVKKCNDLKMK